MIISNQIIPCVTLDNVIENGDGDPSSNPGRGCLHFT